MNLQSDEYTMIVLFQHDERVSIFFWVRGSALGRGDRDLVGDCFEDMLQKSQILIECEQAGARLLSNAVGYFVFLQQVQWDPTIWICRPRRGCYAWFAVNDILKYVNNQEIRNRKYAKSEIVWKIRLEFLSKPSYHKSCKLNKEKTNRENRMTRTSGGPWFGLYSRTKKSEFNLADKNLQFPTTYSQILPSQPWMPSRRFQFR